MKLSYAILWFEDIPEWVKMIMPKIKEIIEKENFDFDFESYEQDGDFNGDLNKFDFILVDYKFGGKNGAELINEIREGNCYTDVLFYSKDGAEDLMKEITKLGLNGIFYCHRDDFLKEFEKIFQKSLKKIQHPNNLRGLVMAETADLDKLKKKILKEYFNLEHNKKEEFEKEIHKKIEDFLKDSLDKINSYRVQKLILTEDPNQGSERKDILKLIDERFFDLSKKARSIKNLIDFLELNLNFNFGEYDEKIISKRNKLAHEPEDQREDGSIYFKDLCFNQEECRKIRKDIKEYKLLLESLFEQLIKIKQEQNSAPGK